MAGGDNRDGMISNVGKLPWIVDKDLGIRDANGFVVATPNLNLTEEEREQMAYFIAGAANATAGGPCNPAKLRVALEKMATWANEDGCECCVAQREQMAKEALEEAAEVDENSRDKGAVTRVDRELAKVRERACEIKGNLGPKNFWEERTERADELLKIANRIEAAVTLDRFDLQCCWEPGSVANIVRQMIETAHDLQHVEPYAAENIGYYAGQLLKTKAGKFPGNAAKLVEALANIRKFTSAWVDAGVATKSMMDCIWRNCDVALSTPMRNCDRGREAAEDAFTAEFGRPWTEEEARVAAWLFEEAGRTGTPRQNADGRAT